MSFNEKLSYTEHVVVSPTTDFAIGFADYGLPSDTINVFVDDVLATEAGYSVTRKNNMVVELQPAVASGVVRLQRATNLDTSFYRFTAGAKFVAANIDANFNQILHSQQETRDGFDKLAGDVYPLVDGLEVALEKADEASKAAQEAADAAEEAAQVTRSASQVTDASGETQQQVNYNGGSKWHSRVDGYKENERVVLANGDIVKSTIDGNANNPNVNMTGWFLIGSNNIRIIATIAELRLTSPKSTNEIVFVTEYSTGSIVGGSYFRYAPEMSSTVFADDAVINIKNGSNIWTRCNSDGSTVQQVPMEWGGVVSTYDYDQSDKVQAVLNAALTYSTNRNLTVFGVARRVSVTPPPKLRCSKTVYFNVTFVEIDGKSSEWAFDSNGIYDAHPTAKALDKTTALKMCLVGRGQSVSNTDSVACYRDRQDLKSLNLYLATSYANDMPQVSKLDTGIIGYASYGLTATLQQAQVQLQNVTIHGFGMGFCNGNYSWGFEFDNCKFSENYYATWLINGEDNGERFSFNSTIMQNNHHALWNESWQGYITVFGGSYVWNDGEYFHIGPSFGAYLRPNHVEYVTSTSSIVTTDATVTAGIYPVYRQVVWEGGLIAISRTNTDTITSNIVLVDAGAGSEVYVRNLSGYWNSIDYTPNMRFGHDAYPWDNSKGRVFVDNCALSIGTWGVLGRCKSLMHVPQTGMLSSNYSTTIASGAVINWVNNTTSDRYMQFKASSTTATANTITFNIPLNRVKDFFAIVPTAWFDSVVTTKTDWTASFFVYNSRLGFGSNTALGDANIFNGSTNIFPLNQFSRPVQVLYKELAAYAQIDTVRVVINMPTGWGANDVFNLRAAGAIVI